MYSIRQIIGSYHTVKYSATKYRHNKILEYIINLKCQKKIQIYEMYVHFSDGYRTYILILFWYIDIDIKIHTVLLYSNCNTNWVGINFMYLSMNKVAGGQKGFSYAQHKGFGFKSPVQCTLQINKSVRDLRVLIFLRFFYNLTL